jgi:hypothetical protein
MQAQSKRETSEKGNHAVNNSLKNTNDKRNNFWHMFRAAVNLEIEKEWHAREGGVSSQRLVITLSKYGWLRIKSIADVRFTWKLSPVVFSNK